jgi:hypothetical protein
LLEYYDPVGMVKAPTWMPEMAKQSPKRSPSIIVRGDGDQAYIIGKDFKELYNLNGKMEMISILSLLIKVKGSLPEINLNIMRYGF